MSLKSQSKDSVHSDSHRGAQIITPPTDSDSEGSLFLTQSITSASGTDKLQRPSKTPAGPLPLQKSKQKKARRTYNTKAKKSGSNRNRKKCLQRLTVQKMVLSLLNTSGYGQHSFQKTYAIMNSEIGGFFMCVKKLKKGQIEERLELSPSLLSSDLEQSDGDEEIRKVNPDCFIRSRNKRNGDSWLPSLKQETSKCTKKSKTSQGEQSKCLQTPKVAKKHVALQDDTHIGTESNSFNKNVSQCKTKGEKSQKSPASSLPHSSTSRLPSDKSPFVQSLFMDHRQEHSENQPQVLVTCSQSQYHNRHHTKTSQTCENLMESLDDVAVNDTQSPRKTDQDNDETQILEESRLDRDGVGVEIPEEQLENENVAGVDGSFISSQDLFEEPTNQASPFKCNSVVADVGCDSVKRSKSQKTTPREIISPLAEDIHQIRRKRDKTILDNRVEHLEDSISGSSPSKNIPIDRLEEKTETPLFISGLKFLKRKKGKKTKASEIFDNLVQVQSDPGQNEAPVPDCNDRVKQKKSKMSKNGSLLEEPVPESNVAIDSGLSVQDSSEVCASSESRPKKKRKIHKTDGLMEEQVGTLPVISLSADSGLSFQDSSTVCAPVGESKPKKKRKKDNNSQLQEDHLICVKEAVQMPCESSVPLVSTSGEPEQLTRNDLSHEVNHLASAVLVNKGLVQTDALEPRKTKKAKKKDLSSMKCDETVAVRSQFSRGTKTVKKKKPFIDGVGEGHVGEMAPDSENLGEAVHPGLNMDAYITPRKKKKRKTREVDENEELLVETTEKVRTQDSEDQAAGEATVKKKKKDRTETRHEGDTSILLGLELNDTSSNTPTIRNEAGGIDEEEGFSGSEPMKKKKKTKKELKGNVFQDLDDTQWHNRELGKESPVPCLEPQLTNDAIEKKKRKRTKSNGSERRQELPQSEDIIQPEGKKKKKKRRGETDIDLHPETVEHVCQESRSPLEPSQSITEKEEVKKKKKKKKSI